MVLGRMGGVISGIFGNLLILGILGLIAILWGLFYLYFIRYKYKVEMHEKSGTGVNTWWTKAGKVYNKNRDREELHILKSKYMAPIALFVSHWRWERPFPGSQYVHKTSKGKTELKFLMIGDKSVDLKPLPPPNGNESQEGDEWKAVDERVHSWYAQGIERDARETRHTKNKWEKVQAFAPYVVFAMLFLAMIFTYQYGRDVNGMAVTVSENLKEASDRVSGVQNVQGSQDNTNPAVNNTNKLAKKAGIDLTGGGGG